MSLSKEEVQNIATLGRLSLSEDEIERFSKEINQILGYVEKLQELDTKGVEPMTGAVEFTHVTRKDEVKKTHQNIKDQLFENAPDKEDTFIKVPKMAA